MDDVKRRTQADSNQAMLAIIDAMEFYKYKEFHFNREWQQVYFPAGVNTLNAPIAPIGIPVTRPGIPTGTIRPMIIQVVGQVLAGDVDLGTVSSIGQLSEQPLIEVDNSTMWLLAGGTGQLSEPHRGMPTHYTWLDGPTRSIRIYPTPNVDLVADVYGSTDAYRPRYSWTANNWLFEQLEFSQGNLADTLVWEWVTLRPTFTNVWLQFAEQMIRAWARHYLYANFYGDQKMMQVAGGQVQREEERMMLEKVAGSGGNLYIKPSSL